MSDQVASKPVYLCSAGHRTPAEATRQTGPVIHCPQAIGLRMECGRNAYRERPAKGAREVPSTSKG